LISIKAASVLHQVAAFHTNDNARPIRIRRLKSTKADKIQGVYENPRSSSGLWQAGGCNGDDQSELAPDPKPRGPQQ